MRLRINRDRLVETMQEQAEIGATEKGGLDRLALTDTDKAIRDWFCEQLKELGLDIRIDEMGNIFRYRAGDNPDASTTLLGSHLDSQPNGDIYDGALGVISALELLRTLEDENITTESGIEVVNWTNEEGSRFHPAMMSSAV